MRGILASEWEITRLAGTGPEGTDEAQLERAAAHYGCDLPTIRKLDFDAARAELIKYLHHGNPCLLCVDGWDHWVTAVHEEKGQFIILDSEKPEVIVALDWPRLEKLWVYHEADDETARTLFDLHPLIPKGRARMRARFSLERAAFLRQPDNHGLAQLWDVYAEDLIALCRAAGPRGGRSLALGEFLRRHEEMLVDQLDTWHGQVERSAAEQVLGRMRFVADTYGLVIRQRDEKRTIAAVSVILALWSAGEFGVAPLYRKVPVRKLR